MKMNEVKKTGHYKIANASAVAIIIFLGINAIIESVRQGMDSESFIGFIMVVVLVLLIPIFNSPRNFSKLAFYTPVIIFLFNAAVLVWGGWNPHFLFVCLCICGISCLYSNFPLAVFYTVAQAIAVGAMLFAGFPVAGTGVPLDTMSVKLAIVLFSSVILLILTKSATITLDKALNEGNSFKTFLATTANYLAMVNSLNQVTYVSKPLSELAGIGDPALAEGRSLIDLFPGRDLKLLTSVMLGQRGFYEADWEFVLDGQKRYFKAASNTLAGSRGTLINLHDMTYLAERDEIAAMKDSLKIGLFFMDRNYIIQDNYSRYLEELLQDRELKGKCFIELMSASVTSKEKDAIKDYFDMVFNHTFEQMILEDINPFNELYYVSPKGDRKIFHCEFLTVERGKGEVLILVTIYDITAKVELQQRLVEEETRRQEEMRTIFELIQVDPDVFSDFLGDAEYEFSHIDEILKNDKLTPHEALVEVYQSVHAIKSNAVILGLNTFGNKVHELESEIKRLREQDTEASFDDMLHLTVALEKLSEKKDGFKTIIDRINVFKGGNADGKKQNERVLVESLAKATDRAASDTGRKVKFVTVGIDSEALEKGPRRLIKEVLMQLVRNSVVHGVEPPEERIAKGKKETGLIRLSIKTDGKIIKVQMADDGRGLDFNKISKKALQQNLIKKEDARNKNALLQAIFSPGFSTAETEGLHAGRGIGLNLVRDRVREAKGTIKLQTEPGKGTVFSILFPAESA